MLKRGFGMPEILAKAGKQLSILLRYRVHAGSGSTARNFLKDVSCGQEQGRAGVRGGRGQEHLPLPAAERPKQEGQASPILLPG